MTNVEHVGSWSITKLDGLERYMTTYASIMTVEKKKWLSEFFYIDAFAGPGLVTMREENAEDTEAQAYLNGSPTRALECEPPFDHLWFIDKKQSRKRNLDQIIEAHCATDRADVLVGDCNDLLGGIVSDMSRSQRALAFLDPYGLQLQWETVKELAATGKLDVFINFSIMGVVRNLPKSGRPAENVVAIMNRVMANTSWIDDLYSDQLDFDGLLHPTRGRLDPRKLAALYAADLRSVFRYVSNPAIMYNSKGGPLYALLLASHKELAISKMNQIIRKGTGPSVSRRRRSSAVRVMH